MIPAMTDKRVKGFSSDFGFGPSDHPEVKNLPFRIMAVGDFCGANRSAAREAIVIDAHDFDKVMATLWPRILFETPNHLGSGKTLEIDFTPSSLKDFEPQHIAAKTPALAPVADFIQRAKGLADGSLKPADFKRDLAPIEAVPVLRAPLEAVLSKLDPSAGRGHVSAGKSGDVTVDAIFDMVDTKKDSGGSAIDSFAASLGGGSKGMDLSGAIETAEKILESQLQHVLDEPVFANLERNWRGLQLLCRRGKGARIEVYDGDFDAWQEAVFKAELAGTSEAPLAMVLLADAIENSAAGMDLLHQWGDAAVQIQCAVVFEAGENFTGTRTEALAAMDAPANLFEDSRFDKWRSLREKDESRWLVAAMNDYVARAGYTRRKHGMDSAIAWGSPVWLVGAVVAQSMERTAWPSAHTGASGGEVTALATVIHEEGAEHPLKARFPEAALKALSRAGFTPLIAQPNNDSAWVLLAPTVHLPSKEEEKGKLGTLAYQLLAARMGEIIMRAKANLVVAGDLETSAQNFAKFLSGLLADTGPGANVDISSQGNTLVLNIRTGRELLGGVEMQLGVNV